MNDEGRREGREVRVLETGSFCTVVLATDQKGREPAAKNFFDAPKVESKDKKKMRGRLRRIAQAGFPSNPDAYRRLDKNIHYVKTWRFRAYCLLREERRELVVCLVCEKKHSGSLPDELKEKAREIFEEHCQVTS